MAFELRIFLAKTLILTGCVLGASYFILEGAFLGGEGINALYAAMPATCGVFVARNIYKHTEWRNLLGEIRRGVFGLNAVENQALDRFNAMLRINIRDPQEGEVLRGENQDVIVPLEEVIAPVVNPNNAAELEDQQAHPLAAELRRRIEENGEDIEMVMLQRQEPEDEVGVLQETPLTAPVNAAAGNLVLQGQEEVTESRQV